MESTTQPPVQKINKRNTEETFLRGIMDALFVFVPAVEKNPCVNVLFKRASSIVAKDALSNS